MKRTYGYRRSKRNRGKNFLYPICSAVVCLFLLIGTTAVIYAYEKSEANKLPTAELGHGGQESRSEMINSLPVQKPGNEENRSESSEGSTDLVSEPAEETSKGESTDSQLNGKGIPGSETENPEAIKEDFSGTVFIGDSRTEGLELYGGLQGATFLTHKGLMVDTVFTKPAIATSSGKLTVMEVLQQTKFDQVYIMLGVNELGWVYSDVFISRYEKVIDGIREINPEAVICVQSILPVTKEKSDKDETYNNKRIQEYNTLLKEMAQRKEVTYQDVAQSVREPDGSLPADAAMDGVHLTADYCKKWANYLRSHSR